MEGMASLFFSWMAFAQSGRRRRQSSQSWCCLLGAGCWVLGAGRWVLGARCWVLGTGCWSLGVGPKCSVLVFWFWVLDAGCWVEQEAWALEPQGSGTVT